MMNETDWSWVILELAFINLLVDWTSLFITARTTSSREPPNQLNNNLLKILLLPPPFANPLKIRHFLPEPESFAGTIYWSRRIP